MGAWSKQKANPSNINNGNEYEKGDRVSRQALNSMINNSLYSSDVIDGMGDGGEYNSSATYIYPNIVTYQGSGYMAIYKENGSYVSFSNILPTNTTYWKLIAEKGSDGVVPNISTAATQLPAGSSPTATVSGTTANPTITFGIPKGDKGDAGGLTIPQITVLYENPLMSDTIVGQSQSLNSAYTNYDMMLLFYVFPSGSCDIKTIPIQGTMPSYPAYPGLIQSMLSTSGSGLRFCDNTNYVNIIFPDTTHVQIDAMKANTTGSFFVLGYKF